MKEKIQNTISKFNKGDFTPDELGEAMLLVSDAKDIGKAGSLLEKTLNNLAYTKQAKVTGFYLAKKPKNASVDETKLTDYCDRHKLSVRTVFDQKPKTVTQLKSLLGVDIKEVLNEEVFDNKLMEDNLSNRAKFSEVDFTAEFE